MLDVFKIRKSCRQFLDKPVEDEKINEILKAAMVSPSAHHQRAWEFIIVKDKDIREKLSETTKYTGCVKEAPVVIVLCSPDVHQWVEDLSIVGEVIYLEATNQGLGTCWMHVKDLVSPEKLNPEGFVRDLLGIPGDKRVLCFFPIGYPKFKMPEHTDQEFEQNKIHYEKW